MEKKQPFLIFEIIQLINNNYLYLLVLRLLSQCMINYRIIVRYKIRLYYFYNATYRIEYLLTLTCPLSCCTPREAFFDINSIILSM